MIAACAAAAPTSSSWWPAIFGHRGSDSESQDDAAARRGMHSAYLASKSKELEGFEDNLVSEMHRRARTSSCWKDAVTTLESRCRSELLREDQRSRMALHFTACQLHHDGKVSWESARSPHRCAPEAEIADCVGLLEDNIYPLYIQFRLHVDTLCFHAQEELFQERTETAVSMLDRVSNAALARTKDLTKRSTELVQSLDDSRRAQTDILTQTRSTSEWLQGQYRAHQDILGTIAQHATATSQRVVDLGAVIDDANTLHQQSLANVKGELSSVLEAQQSAAAAAQALAASLTSLAASSESQMLQHQSQLETVALRTQRMAEDAAAQQQHFLQSHTTMIELLERVFSTQQYIAGSASLVEKMVVYVCGGVVALIATSLPRVASARPLCLIVLMLGWYVETFQLDMVLSGLRVWNNIAHEFGSIMLRQSDDDIPLSGRSAFNHNNSGFFHSVPHDGAPTLHLELCEAARCIRLGIVVIMCWLVIQAGWHYISPEESHRRLIVKELENWWTRLQSNLSIAQRSHDDADGWWDQGDGTMCVGDVWIPQHQPTIATDTRSCVTLRMTEEDVTNMVPIGEKKKNKAN